MPMIHRLSRLIEEFVSIFPPGWSFFLKHSRHASSKIGWLVSFPLVFLAIMPWPGVAQSGPPAKSAKGVQILLPGTAGGPPIRTKRSEPSSLLIVDGRQYLIDCGIGTIRRMVRAGIRSGTIGTIFFTHLHPDHALGLADIMANDLFTMHFAGGLPTINIYGPPQTAEFVKAALNYVSIPFGIFEAEGLPGSVHAAHFEAHEISKDGAVYRDDKIRVVAAENSHYTLIPAKFRGQMKSYSYRFETAYGVIVFTGDTGPSDAVARLAKGADVLVTEASIASRAQAVRFVNEYGEQYHLSAERTRIFREHMTLGHLDQEEIGGLATRAQVKSVLLYHFDPRDPAAYVAGVKKYFSGPVFASADLERYCLSTGSGDEAAARGLRPCH
jgi:ribonuclease BN (tRNA processing enzyme)